MRQIPLLFISVLLIFFAQSLHAQNTFQRYFTVGDSACSIFDISITPSGDIFASGTLRKVGNFSNIDAIVWKLTAAGTPIWTRKLPRGSSTGINTTDIEALDDGGALVSVGYYTGAVNNYQIIRLDASGNIKWAKELDNNPDFGIDNINTIKGGYLLSGYFPGSASKTVLIKIDDNGNILWSKKLANIAINAITITEDSNGTLFLPGSSGLRGTLLKLASNGDILKSVDYEEGTTGRLGVFTGCNTTSNDSLVLTGYDLEGRFMLLKIDRNGNPGRGVWMGTTSTPYYTAAAHSDLAGNIYVSVYKNVGSGAEAIFCKFDPNLGLVWNKEYGNPTNGNYVFYNSQRSKTENAFLLAGSFFQNLNESAYIVKTDYDGNISGPCCPKPYTIAYARFQTNSQISDINEISNVAMSTITQNVTPTTTEGVDLCPLQEKIQPDSLVNLCPGGCIIVSMTNPRQGAQYHWDFQGASPDSSNVINPGQVCYGAKGTYKIVLTEGGCMLAMDSVIVDNPQDLFPNAFAPNGFNTTFAPIIRCPVEEYYLQIFNRWGDLVFESFDVKETWNGEVYGKPAPMDTYIYRVQYYAVRDGVRQLVYEAKKEVTLIR
jgi:gliding motility-associated-like protein